MIQVFLIIAFILGFVLGWKLFELVITNAIYYLATQDNSGIEINVNSNKIIIDVDVLKNFKINKENFS